MQTTRMTVRLKYKKSTKNTDVFWECDDKGEFVVTNDPRSPYVLRSLNVQKPIASGMEILTVELIGVRDCSPARFEGPF